VTVPRRTFVPFRSEFGTSAFWSTRLFRGPVSARPTDHSLLAVDFKAGQLGVGGYEIVRGRSDVTSQLFNSLALTCSPGQRAVGGGGGTAGRVVPGDGRYIVSISPSTAAAVG